MLYHVHLQSQYLNKYTDLHVLTPNKPKNLTPKEYYANGKKYRVLWLLHGHGSDYSDWQRKSNIELYSRDYDMIVVFVNVGNSSYAKWDIPSMYLDSYNYITEELMPYIHNWFPASDKPEDNFICGFSMGSIGAFKFVANRPELWGGAACLSACPANYRAMAEEGAGNIGMLETGLFLHHGDLDELLASEDNVWDRILENKDKLPPIYASCGTADSLYETNYLPFKEYAQEQGLDIVFSETEGAAHDFWFWDPEIMKALEFWGIAEPGAAHRVAERGL